MTLADADTGQLDSTVMSVLWLKELKSAEQAGTWHGLGKLSQGASFGCCCHKKEEEESFYIHVPSPIGLIGWNIEHKLA